MAGFGGSVKLTGESEYRKALKEITVNLKEVSSEMKLVSAQYDKNDNSIEAVTARSQALTKQLTAQKTALSSLESEYSKLSSEQEKNKEKHNDLTAQYDREKAELERIGNELGTSSAEYKAQALVVSDLAKDVDKSTQANAKNEQTLSGMRTEMNNLKTSIAGTEKELSKMDDADDSMNDLAVATKDASKASKSASEGFTVFKGVLSNLTSTAIKKALEGIKKLGSAMVDTVNEITDLGDEIDKQSQKLGITAENYQMLSYAVERCGADVEDFKKGTINISKELAKVQNGTKDAGKTFDELGVSLKKADGSMRSTEDVLLDSIDALANVQDEVKRNSLANAIFGKSYSELIPLLNSGSKGIKSLMQESKSYGMILSNKTVKASVAFKDSLTKLSGTVTGLKSRLVEKLLPSLTMIVDGFSDLINGSDDAKTKITKGLEELKKNALNIIKSLMPDVYNNVIPVIEKITKAVGDIVSFITKNFSTIAPIVMTAVTAFTAFNAVMSITATVSAVTTAISGLTAGVGLATKAQVAWNAVMSANPIGAVITAVATLTAGIALLIGNTKKITKVVNEELLNSLSSEKEQIDSNVKSWSDLTEAQKKQLSAGMSELNYYSKLVDELKSITDENGKVKDGYEKRASFITSQLSDALGVEIKLVDGVIKKYGNLMETIDQVMEKKKADIILSSQEALYKTAIENQAQALRDYAKYQSEYLTLEKKIKDSRKEMNELLAKDINSMTETEKKATGERILALQSWLSQNEDALPKARSNYEEQKKLVSEYAYNIGQYEKNMALAHEGKYDEMTTTTWDYVKDYENATDQQKKATEDQITSEEANLKLLEELKRKSGSDLYDMQIKQAKQRIAKLKGENSDVSDVTKEGLKDVKVKWKDGLDEQLSQITGKKVQFKDAGDGLVQMYVDGVKVGKPKAKDEMADVVTKSIKEISKQETKAEQAGEDLIEGVNDGIANQKKQNSAFSTIKNFGTKLLNSLKKSLKEKSPSKATNEMGQFLLIGLQNGIEEEERGTLSQISQFGNDAIKALNSELAKGADLGSISSDIQSAIPSIASSSLTASGLPSNSLASTGGIDVSALVDAFKTAMAGMEIEMGEDGFAQFVVKTVANEIYV